MSKRQYAAGIIVSLILFLALGLSTSQEVLEIRTSEGTRTLCFPVQSGEEITFRSVNSIYNVPVEEQVSISDRGEFVTTQVVSSPAVMEYYRLDDYSPRADGQMVAAPRQARYREIRLRVDARGEWRLIVRGKEFALDRMVPESTSLVFALARRPRLAACN